MRREGRVECAHVWHLRAAPQGTRGLSVECLVPEIQEPRVSSLQVAIARGRKSDPLGTGRMTLSVPTGGLCRSLAAGREHPKAMAHAQAQSQEVCVACTLSPSTSIPEWEGS